MTNQTDKCLKNDLRSYLNMRKMLVVLATLMILSLPLSSAAGTAGEDRLPDLEETPFQTASATSPSIDGVLWEVDLTLDQAYAENNTTMEIATQICTNDGVCDPPVVQEVTLLDGVFSASVTPPSDHTYVNFRVTLNYEDGSNENFPKANWYTTWSTCYYDSGEWGGVDSTEDGCGEDSPGFGIIAAISGISMAAIISSRRD